MELLTIAAIAAWILVEQTDSGYEAMIDRMRKSHENFQPNWTESGSEKEK